MIDRTKIPEKTLEDLIELFGYEGAENILNEEGYSFEHIQQKIFSERLKRRFGRRIFIYAGLIGLVIAIIYEILRANYII